MQMITLLKDVRMVKPEIWSTVKTYESLLICQVKVLALNNSLGVQCKTCKSVSTCNCRVRVLAHLISMHIFQAHYYVSVRIESQKRQE